jgi:ADP-ribose pyrophosphatase YjhB (NUDIX family)
VREWLVAAGLIEGPEGLLLVQNRRRDRSFDWSPPGGVIEVHEGESVRDGLTREVAEETGLVVTDWDGPVYNVDVVAEGLGWTLHVEAYRAVSYQGELVVADPDGIVVDARFVESADWEMHFHGAHPWVREPVVAFLADGSPALMTSFRYRLEGTAGQFEVLRLHEQSDA